MTVKELAKRYDDGENPIYVTPTEFDEYLWHIMGGTVWGIMLSQDRVEADKKEIQASGKMRFRDRDLIRRNA